MVSEGDGSRNTPTAKLTSAQTGLPAAHIEDKDQHTDQVTALAWLPDGSGFLSAGMDKSIVLWVSAQLPSLIAFHFDGRLLINLCVCDRM